MRRRCAGARHRDGGARPQWQPVLVRAGEVLDVGAVSGPGLRIAIAVAGGVAAQQYLGSASTFTMGRFGGHEGRALVAGDKLRVAGAATGSRRRILIEEQPRSRGAGTSR